MTQNKYIIVFLTACLVALYCCKDKWDDHYNLNGSQNSNDLLQQIKATPELSKFYDYLTKTGYDKILGSSQFTIWAPTNDALASLDAAIASDTVKLKQFIGNYICYQAYYNDTPDSSLQIKMLNGKHITIYKNGQTIENANLIAPYDRPCRNGVLHIIDHFIDTKPTIREYLLGEDPNLEQVFFLKTLDKLVIDVAKSTRIGVDSKGNTIYDTVWVNSSPYLKNIANLDDENEIFTYILLTNNAFEQAFNAYRPYSKMPIAQQWDSLTAYNVCSDLAIKGKYNLNNLPDTLISTNGIKVNIDKQSIIKTADLSNGAVIMLDKYPVQLKNKVKPIILEGENPVGRSFTPKKDTTFRSVVKRYDPMASGGYDLIYNFSSGSAFWVQFTANNIFSAKYKFYWVAPNYIYNLKNKITGTPNAVVDTVINYFNQVLSVNPYNSNTALFTFGQALTTANYTETYIGEYTFAAFANAVSLRVSGVTIKALPSPPTTATASPSFATAVSVDYIKMVPVIQ